MSWPAAWACGLSGPRLQQTPAKERSSRTGTRAQYRSPPPAGSRAPPRKVPATMLPRPDARGESERRAP
eukprot:15198803-Alexandrium_andersonii.AAC.1